MLNKRNAGEILILLIIIGFFIPGAGAVGGGGTCIPTPDFNSDIQSGHTPLHVNFSPVLCTETVTDWFWEYSGTTASGAVYDSQHVTTPPGNTTYDFGVGGTWDVALNITVAGTNYTATKTGYIHASDLKADFANVSTSPRSGTAPFTTSFIPEVTGSFLPVDCNWSFGDGDFASDVCGSTKVHTYTNPGIYPVSLQAWDAYSTNISLKPGYVTVADSEGFSPGTSFFPGQHLH